MVANFTTILLALEQAERRRARRYWWAVYAVESSLALFLLVLLADSRWPRPCCVKSATVGRCSRDLGELRAVGFVSRDRKDFWGRPFIIEYLDTFIRVCSGGRDEVHPEDDMGHKEHRDGR